VNDWKSVIAMMADGSLDPTDLITHVYKLEEGQEAFATLMGDDLYTKIMFEMD
jgi:threonine dehydrogenase-like Zn-dependent dehydrogenase